ncbi:hypothetical protein LTR85_002057 [Meristemomyces frigidus]|nr:hypothetical protein LTR85_002057 [Meristemomyces frigidus]
MVSFSCENCGDVLTKKKLDQHRNQCRGATFTCLDCMVHFYGTDYRAHTSCISEAQKYQGHLYKDKDKKGGKGDRRKSMPGSFPDNSQAMVPRNAYVEDATEGDDMNAVAVVDVPPRAPTPPPAHEALPENVNVFDFLVSEATPDGSRREIDAANGARMIEETRHYGNGDSQYSQYSNGDGSQYTSHGFSYGHAPVQPGVERYDSWQNMNESQQSQLMPPPPPYVTPGPRSERKEKHKSEKSDKKRKRQQVEDLDLSSASKRPSSRGDEKMADAHILSSGGRVLHSGLTGGLHKLVTDPEFFDDRIDAGPTPISPLKRTKRDKEAKDERRKSSYTSYSTTSAKTSSSKHPEEKRQRSHSKDRESQSSKRHHRKRRDSSSSADERHRSTSRKEYKAIDYPPIDRPASVQPTATNQLGSHYRSPAELFLSFVNKGPESERGCSLNKALKRYHRERDVRGEEKEDEDKELWKSLRMRRNERGEIVLFI